MEKIIILDFGSQYCQLIARRIRECHVYSEILPFDTPAEVIAAENPQGIILSGGPASVYAENAPRCDKRIFALDLRLAADHPHSGWKNPAELRPGIWQCSVENQLFIRII